MYDELVRRLRESADWADHLAVLMGRAEDVSSPIKREAADAIEELFGKDINVPRWIPVTEMLPENRKVVLITDGIDVGTGWVNQGWWNTSFADIQQDAVTHWTPLPEPPEEEQ